MSADRYLATRAGTLLASLSPEEVSMKPSNQTVGNDPTIMGNERPRRDRDDDRLPKDAQVQHEDPRNGLNRPVNESDSLEPSDDRDDE